MSYINVYSSRINWENEPSIVSPINATNLNKMDYALYEMDGTFANWDTTKANESDMLLAIKSVDYDTETGVFLFTWFNGTTKTVDLNIEKIPVSFSMSPQGVITMKTEDGTEYTADVGSLIKTYTFNDSSEIDFSVTTDGSGNKTVTASLVAGSIDGTKLTPNYLADCTAAKTGAENAADAADDSAEDAEAWAVGQRNGTDVPSTDPTYHNNAKYWSEQSNPTTLTGLTDTDINNPQNGQALIYDSTNAKWINGAGGGGASEYANLLDVRLTSLQNGQITRYNSTSAKWENANYDMSGLSDVQISSISNGDALRYNSTAGKWENVALPSYEALYGVTEITSSAPDLNNYTTPGNYYKSDTSFALVNYKWSNALDRISLTVKSLYPGDEGAVVQETVCRRGTTTSQPARYYRVGAYRTDTTAWEWSDWRAYADAATVHEISERAGNWSSEATCAVGATTVTFSDNMYETYWAYEIWCNDGTDTEIPLTWTVDPYDNQVVVTFKKALERATRVKVHYYRFEYV